MAKRRSKRRSYTLLAIILILAVVAFAGTGISSIETTEDIDICYDFIKTHAPYEGYDPATGEHVNGGAKLPPSAALSIRFLRSYLDLRPSKADEIKAEIKYLADFQISTQCVDPSKDWYGGFPSAQGGTWYSSIDAAFGGESMLWAYEISGDKRYLDSAILCATFLRHMQMWKSTKYGVPYRGGFSEAVVSSNGAYVSSMYTKMLLALPFLKKLAQITGNNTYNVMAEDAKKFLVIGLTTHYDYFFPKGGGYGDDLWHRYGDNIISDSTGAYPLRGLYEYEGLTDTVKTVYDFYEGFAGTGYEPRFAWCGYADVVHQTAGTYYDCVTGGLLASIRKVYDKGALDYWVNKFQTLQAQTFYWGLKYDFTPVGSPPFQSTNTAAGIGWGLCQARMGWVEMFRSWLLSPITPTMPYLTYIWLLILLLILLAIAKLY